VINLELKVPKVYILKHLGLYFKLCLQPLKVNLKA